MVHLLVSSIIHRVTTMEKSPAHRLEAPNANSAVQISPVKLRGWVRNHCPWAHRTSKFPRWMVNRQSATFNSQESPCPNLNRSPNNVLNSLVVQGRVSMASL